MNCVSATDLPDVRVFPFRGTINPYLVIKWDGEVVKKVSEYPCDCLGPFLDHYFKLFSTGTTEIRQSQGYEGAMEGPGQAGPRYRAPIRRPFIQCSNAPTVALFYRHTNFNPLTHSTTHRRDTLAFHTHGLDESFQGQSKTGLPNLLPHRCQWYRPRR